MKWTSACVASDPSKRWDFGNSACPDVHTEGFSEVWYSYLAEYRGGRRDDREGCSPLDGELGRTYQAAASNPRVREGRDLLPTSYMYSPTFWINDWPYDLIRCHRLGLVPLYIETARLSLVRFPGQKVVLWERIDFRAGKKAVAWNDRRANTNVSLADWSVKTVNMSSLYDVAEADRSRRLIPGESRCHLPANGGRSFFLHTLDGIWGRDLAQ